MIRHMANMHSLQLQQEDVVRLPKVCQQERISY